MKEYYLGIDIGTSSIRAVLFDQEGTQIEMDSIGCSIISPQDGWAEIEPDSIVHSSISTVKNCIKKSGIDSKHIAAMGISCHMHSLMAVDEHGNPLTRLTIWADTRAKKESEFIEDNYDVGKLYNKTGCRVQHPMYPLSKIFWFKNNQRDVFNSAHKFITAKEYLIYKLYGVFVVDYTLAASQGYYNISKQNWDEDILVDILGITRYRFGEVVECTYTLKGMKPEYSRLLELDSQIPMAIGTGDGIAANIGCGVSDDTAMSCTIGTSGAIRTAVDSPLLDPFQQTWCYSFTNDTWVAGGAINNGGIVLKWLKEQFKQQFESDAEALGESVYELFDRYASEINPGSDRLLFLPYLTGERCPDWNADARGLMFGLSYSHWRKHFIRAAMEGVMYRMYSVYEALSRLRNTARQIRANGGYASSQLWMQIQADIFDKEILVSGVSEASALGAAYISMVSLGNVKNMRDLLPGMEPKRIIRPLSENHQIYRKMYERSKQIYGDVYHK